MHVLRSTLPVLVRYLTAEFAVTTKRVIVVPATAILREWDGPSAPSICSSALRCMRHHLWLELRMRCPPKLVQMKCELMPLR
jgi:hypothetical protein